MKAMRAMMRGIAFMGGVSVPCSMSIIREDEKSRVKNTGG